jgi:catechol 1,2-dioxygenase
MPNNLIKRDLITALAARAAGLDQSDGDPRLKQVVNRLLSDLMVAIDELDISMDEFWLALPISRRQANKTSLG